MTAPLPPGAAMYAARDWGLIACEPDGKRPLAAACPHGVKDATTDLSVIADWYARWPDANWGIATGKPGPQVLDIDDPDNVPTAVNAAARNAPQVRTARGGHVYFEGTDQGTVSLGYGELRGRGSYVLCPPSIHPSGKEYVWLQEPRGRLPTVPPVVTRTANPSVGAGDMPQVETIAPQEGMHEHLADLATRLARSGVLHIDVIERALLAEFEAAHDPAGDWGDPRQGRAETRRIAEWAVDTRIAEREAARNGDQPDEPTAAPELVITPIELFASEHEAGARAVLGTDDEALIPEGADVMIYGDGGAGKTTLAVDMAFHLAGGRDWLEIPIPRSVNVLLIENEGPRPMFRRKLRRKLEACDTGTGWVSVLEQPWGQFTFEHEAWRDAIARQLTEHNVDVVIAGPLTRIGMNEAGTLQQVVAFMELIADVRARYPRPLAVILIHHENKAGSVSGAWEGSGDTLLHVEAAGNGHTILFVQKARWAPEWHRQTLKLSWAAGEGFELDADRDTLAELEQLLSDGVWRTVREIAAPTEKGGIGVNFDTVKELLDENPDRFESCTGDDAKAVGRHPTAILWGCLRGSETPETPTVSPLGKRGGCLSVSPVGGDTQPEAQHSADHNCLSDAETPEDDEPPA